MVGDRAASEVAWSGKWSRKRTREGEDESWSDQCKLERVSRRSIDEVVVE